MSLYVTRKDLKTFANMLPADEQSLIKYIKRFIDTAGVLGSINNQPSYWDFHEADAKMKAVEGDVYSMKRYPIRKAQIKKLIEILETRKAELLYYKFYRVE